MKKIYNKIRNNKSLKIIITSILCIITLLYFTFIQYENIMYNKKINIVKKDVKELIIKINELKGKEAQLEANINDSSSELATLKNDLTILQTDLKIATDKLNSL